MGIAAWLIARLVLGKEVCHDKANPNGNTTENPRLRAVKSLIADLLAFRRSLGVNARAKSEAHVAHKKTAIAKQIEDDAFLNCDLIAKPIY